MNTEQASENICTYIPSGFSMLTISSFKDIENKHDVYRGKDCIKKFCECLKNHARKIINFTRKKNEVFKKRTARII